MRLGNTDMEVSRLCLGGNVFGWTTEERASFAVLDAYARSGGNFIDTADIYGRRGPHGLGESERIIGRWLAEALRVGEQDGMAVQSTVAAPIASATSSEQLAGLLPSMTLELSREEVERLAAAGA